MELGGAQHADSQAPLSTFAGEEDEQQSLSSIGSAVAFTQVVAHGSDDLPSNFSVLEGPLAGVQQDLCPRATKFLQMHPKVDSVAA